MDGKGLKIKIFELESDSEEDEKKFSEFVKDKEIIEIKPTGNYLGKHYLCVIYKDKK